MPDTTGPAPVEQESVERRSIEQSSAGQSRVAVEQSSVEQIGENRIRIRVGDREFEADSLCPHRKGFLAHGYVNAARLRITCPLHHSSFSLETGEAVTGPTRTPLCVRETTERSPEPVN
ncbi:Rieske (2Fe-2S) protein [Streptomyces sp. NPDC020379]|uniref:Rieske (2Fe-2S) protein n=1 Tax=Streptomyces sp. NPDC020379 TaxID=3365071 RepID=UPI0037A247D9